MATPGLRDGFYEIGQGVPQRAWDLAVRSYGVRRYGKRLSTTYADIGTIDLMVTGAVAVSLRGERIGKGTGYFDWEYVILREIGSITAETPVIAVVHHIQVCEVLPWEPKDVSVDYIATPEGIIKVRGSLPRPGGIDWRYVTKGLRAKMRPFRELYSRHLA
jgi:5-formyltetrahydrofolate cyclo-ligase